MMKAKHVARIIADYIDNSPGLKKIGVYTSNFTGRTFVVRKLDVDNEASEEDEYFEVIIRKL